MKHLGVVFVLAALAASSAFADAGHDHGDKGGAKPIGNSPQRRPDGHVFLPKLSQRHLAVRTLTVEEKNVPRTFELMGRVTMDPNAGGKVQPTIAGRIEPGPRGLPNLGQRIARGEVLAYVRASETAPTEARVNLELAERRLARLEQLEGTVPQKEIEAARIELQALRDRNRPGGGTLTAREPLLAPVSGVIATANAVAGQVVEPRELLFEIVDPSRVRIEAVAFDAARAADIAAASADVGGANVALRFVGIGRSLRDGALPVAFAVAPVKDGTLPPLAINQPVRVIATTRTQVRGVPIPAAAIVKNPSNQDIVWVHESAEVFAPRPVVYEPVDAATVVVLRGLLPGERVVVQAAPLVNQVR